MADEMKTGMWEYFSPTSIVSDSISTYTSPFGAAIYGPWSALGRGRGPILPGLLPIHSHIPPLRWMSGVAKSAMTQGWRSITSDQFRAGKVGKFLGTTGRSLLFGIGGSKVDSAALMVADKGVFGARKAYLKKAMKFGTLAKKTEDVAMAARAAGYVEKARAVGSFANIGKVGLITAGRVMTPIMDLAALYQITQWGVETAYKGIRSTVALIERSTDRISNMELGGDLSRGFLTTQAATERQRAIQAIQGSAMGGRRVLGSEAQLYHG